VPTENAIRRECLKSGSHAMNCVECLLTSLTTAPSSMQRFWEKASLSEEEAERMNPGRVEGKRLSVSPRFLWELRSAKIQSKHRIAHFEEPTSLAKAC
jgi:hypothetical protein